MLARASQALLQSAGIPAWLSPFERVRPQQEALLGPRVPGGTNPSDPAADSSPAFRVGERVAKASSLQKPFLAPPVAVVLVEKVVARFIE
jgi:hypothetical protein